MDGRCVATDPRLDHQHETQTEPTRSSELTVAYFLFASSSFPFAIPSSSPDETRATVGLRIVEESARCCKQEALAPQLKENSDHPVPTSVAYHNQIVRKVHCEQVYSRQAREGEATLKSSRRERKITVLFTEYVKNFEIHWNFDVCSFFLVVTVLVWTSAACRLAPAQNSDEVQAEDLYNQSVAMIPMRDGVKLYTELYLPKRVEAAKKIKLNKHTKRNIAILSPHQNMNQ